MKTTRFFWTVLIFGTGLLSWNPLGGSQKKLGRVRALGNRVAEWSARRPYTAASGVLLCGVGLSFAGYAVYSWSLCSCHEGEPEAFDFRLNNGDVGSNMPGGSANTFFIPGGQSGQGIAGFPNDNDDMQNEDGEAEAEHSDTWSESDDNHHPDFLGVVDNPDFLGVVNESFHNTGGDVFVSIYGFDEVTCELSEEGCSCNLCFESKADKEDVAMGAMGCCKTAIICEECFKQWREAGGYVCPWCRTEFQDIHNKLHNGIS